MDLPMITSERLYQKISRLLLEKIRQGDYSVGEALPSERDLARQLGVSRASVREALIALEVSGWVEIRMGNGVFVKSNQPELALGMLAEPGVEALLQARELIEGELAAQAACQATPAQLLLLAQLTAGMQSAQADPVEFHQLDKRFHQLIAAMTGNAVLGEISDYLWNQRYSPLFLQLEQHYARSDGATEVIDDHQAIANALLTREPAAARQAMRQHLQHVRQRLFQSQEVELGAEE